MQFFLKNSPKSASGLGTKSGLSIGSALALELNAAQWSEFGAELGTSP
jgi:hypothetical protein